MSSSVTRSTSIVLFLLLIIASAGLVAAALSGDGRGPDGRPGGKPVPALDAILQATDRAPLVALGEPHGLQQLHDLLQALIRHPQLPARIDDIVVEFGNALHQDVLDRYISGEPVPLGDLQKVWRDHTTSLMQTWDSPVYQRFFEAVRQVNLGRPAGERIRVLAGDPPIDWTAVSGPQDVFAWLVQRDSHLADVVVREVLQKNRRALLIAGTMHVVRRSASHPNLPPVSNAVQTIEAQHPGSTFVVATHTGFGPGTSRLEARLAAWTPPSIGPVAGTWLGRLPAGMLFSDTVLIGPPGSDPPADPWDGLTISDLIDAYLYVGPSDALTLTVASPLLMRDEAYFSELNRRSLLVRRVPLMPAPQYYRYGFPPRPPLAVQGIEDGGGQ